MNLEQWLVANLIPLIGTVFIATVAVVWIKTQGNHGIEAKLELEKHRKESNPHPECPVHKSMLEDISDKLDRIDERVYALFKSNGFGKHDS